jgi:hypothetical protein
MNVQNSNTINAVKTALLDKKTWRVANMLLKQKEATRRELEPYAGTTYSPLEVESLRKAGLSIPCEMRKGINRDGDACRYGVYSLTDRDREILHHAQALPSVVKVA